MNEKGQITLADINPPPNEDLFTLRSLYRYFKEDEYEAWVAYFSGQFDDEVKRRFEGATIPQARATAFILFGFMRRIQQSLDEIAALSRPPRMIVRQLSDEELLKFSNVKPGKIVVTRPAETNKCYPMAYVVYSGSENLDIGDKVAVAFCSSEPQAAHMAKFWAPYGYYEEVDPLHYWRGLLPVVPFTPAPMPRKKEEGADNA